MEFNTVVVLLSCCLGLVALMTLLLLGVSGRVRRIEKLLHESTSRQEMADDAPSVAETSPGGAFENFLNEDPSRKSLSKSEQFAAYRQWRHEKGMNWSNS